MYNLIDIKTKLFCMLSSNGKKNSGFSYFTSDSKTEEIIDILISNIITDIDALSIKETEYFPLDYFTVQFFMNLFWSKRKDSDYIRYCFTSILDELGITKFTLPLKSAGITSIGQLCKLLDCFSNLGWQICGYRHDKHNKPEIPCLVIKKSKN